MSKAEERALDKYPKKIEWVGNQWDGAPFDVNSKKRFYYQQGYKEAEKDNELTWKDIADILDVTDVIANDDSMEERLKTISEEEYCQEVLNRFNKLKGK